MLPLKLFAQDTLAIQAPTRHPHAHSASSQAGQGPPVRRGRVKRRGSGGGQKRTERVGAGPRGGGCVAPRVPEPGTRSLGRVGRNARGAERAGLAAQPERVREGAGQSPSERRLWTHRSKLGRGCLAERRRLAR